MQHGSTPTIITKMQCNGTQTEHPTNRGAEDRDTIFQNACTVSQISSSSPTGSTKTHINKLLLLVASSYNSSI